jgi:large subunit ribosomal protein L17
MRHKRIGRKLGVTTKHRKAMLRNMVTDLFRNNRLKTTDTRAKELRRVAEKIITLAKEGTLHKRRQAGAYIRDKEVLKKLFDELAERFKDRPGGYTRITKLGFRRGDNTPISIIELVEEEYKPKKAKKAKAAPKKPKAAAKDGSVKAKSSKKESAEELGLIEEQDKKTEEVLAAEAAVVAETVEIVKEETEPKAKAEEAPEPEAKEAAVEETPAAESESAAEAQPEETAEEKIEELAAETVEEPSDAPEVKAEPEPEAEIEAKTEESSEEQAEDGTRAEEDKETEKKED